MYRSPVDLYIDQWVYDLLEAVERSGARRVLIDSLTDLQHAAPDEARFREYMYSLLQRFSRQGVSLFMTSELADLFDVSRLSEFGVSHLSDNVVLLQYIREAAAVRRALTVLKTRASRHEPQIREFRITSEGILLGDRVRLGAHSRAAPPVAGRAARRAPPTFSCWPSSMRTCRSACSSTTPARSRSCMPTRRSPASIATGRPTACSTYPRTDARTSARSSRHSSRKWLPRARRSTCPSSVTSPPSTRQAGGAPPSTASTPTAGGPSWSRSPSTSPTRFARDAYSPSAKRASRLCARRSRPFPAATSSSRFSRSPMPSSLRFRSTWRRSDCSTQTPSSISSPPAAFARLRSGASRSSRSPLSDPRR